VHEGQLLLNQADRDRLVALKKAKKKLITQEEAAEELGITERHVRRLLKRLPFAACRGYSLATGKKTVAAIHEEVTREVDQLLLVIFNGRRKTGRVDLEAIEMLVRSFMHQAGAAALTELPSESVPDACAREPR